MAGLRQEYMREELEENHVSADPFEQFQQWFDGALADEEVCEPNAMTLATATADGKPSARIVLLKGFDRRGFAFYTNYNSRKGQELADNPYAALVLWWQPQARQIRIEGRVEKLNSTESDAYFQSRPLGSQLGALASPQSQTVENRDYLEQRLQNLTEQYRSQPIPRPAHWGGYRLNPSTIEFWQGRPNRLHDRLCYRRLSEDRWHMERLAP